MEIEKVFKELGGETVYCATGRFEHKETKISGWYILNDEKYEEIEKIDCRLEQYEDGECD